jgi:hypothetical protein
MLPMNGILTPDVVHSRSLLHMTTKQHRPHWKTPLRDACSDFTPPTHLPCRLPVLQERTAKKELSRTACLWLLRLSWFELYTNTHQVCTIHLWTWALNTALACRCGSKKVVRSFLFCHAVPCSVQTWFVCTFLSPKDVKGGGSTTNDPI